MRKKWVYLFTEGNASMRNLLGGKGANLAEKLFIVRQTLYHRLEKIEHIIGDNFMNYENRLCLEIMLLMTKHNYMREEKLP